MIVDSTTLWRPYVAGVLHGDAWCSKLTIGLRCSDQDFSQAFCSALQQGFDVWKGGVRRGDRGYWLLRASNLSGRFSHLKDYEPRDNDEVGNWLRGLFDSEGSALIYVPNKRLTNSYHRRVSMVSTEISTIERASAYLSWLDISHSISTRNPSAGHFGSKPVHEIRVVRQDGFERFHLMVGFNIVRKQEALKRIIETYEPDRSAGARARQLLGATARHKKTMDFTLPKVIEGVARLIVDGIKPTQRACRSVVGYGSIQRYVSQDKLVAMARQLLMMVPRIEADDNVGRFDE